ncbi:MAG: helicase-related protein, partial [Bradymonadaceae bacterium]
MRPVSAQDRGAEGCRRAPNRVGLYASWYARVYESGKLQRIRSAEHTGLLEKDERQDLEDQFKEGSGPESPNLVVCTPTLEMGIDIGDLSTLMLCSVPPTTANYRQRVGRAGRESGNAFCLTLAESRPHDLYFFEQPMTMAAGDVSVPGCFLDAVDMLERQLAARCVDAWTAEDDDVRSVPRNVRELLTSSGRKTFPGRFVRWCERQDLGFVDDFLAHFGDHVSDESRDQLRHY